MGLYTKLHALQKDIDPIKKDETNPFFRSKYFDINGLIEAVQPLLTKHGLVIIQPLSDINGKPAITTIVTDIESGEMCQDTIVIPEQTDIQKFGAAVTYMRRYALQSLLLLQAEDDDGNTAVSKKPTPKATVEPQESHLTDNDDPFSGWEKKEPTVQSGHVCEDCGKEYTPKPGTEKFSKKCLSCFLKSRK